MMISTRIWKQIQALSGVFFGLFLTLHLTAHISNVVSQTLGNTMLAHVRAVYQWLPFEIALGCSVLVHMLSNTVLYMKRNQKTNWSITSITSTTTKLSKSKSTTPTPTATVTNSQYKKTDGDDDNNGDSPGDKHDNQKMMMKKTYIQKTIPGSFELKLHRYTGYLLSFFVFGHIWAVRIAPVLALEGRLNAKVYDYTMVYLAMKDFGWGFAIYLMLLGGVGIWHLNYGMYASYVLLGCVGGSSIQGKPFPKSLTVLAFCIWLAVINGVMGMVGWHHFNIVVSEASIAAHWTISNYIPPAILFVENEGTRP